MALGEYRPPNQINKDEDKYWKLTKTQIMYGICGLMIGIPVFLLLRLTQIIMMQILGAVFVFILVVFGVAVGGLNIPDSKYLKGGGLRMDKYLIRKVKKKLLKRYHVVYTRNIDRDRIVFYQSKAVVGEEKPSLIEDLKSMFGGE